MVETTSSFNSSTQASNQTSNDEDPAQNAGARAVEIDSDPTKSLEKARNAAEGKAPNAAGSVAPSTAEEHVRGTSDPKATDIPSANRPGS